MRGNCALMQEISDFGCTLKGIFCGANRIFKMIVKKRRIGYSSFECLLRCECAVGYYQRNDQCIKGPISPKERFNLVNAIYFIIIYY